MERPTLFVYLTQRFVISLDSSHHSGANIAEAEVDSFARPSALVITAATTIASTVDPVVARDEEIKNLKVQLLLKEAEATKAICLRAKASKLETTKKSLRDEVNALNEHNNILEKERKALDVKVTDLEAIVVRKERELTDSTARLQSSVSK
nr:hypothetical protein [Tanacetum cinerariifolium]